MLSLPIHLSQADFRWKVALSDYPPLGDGLTFRVKIPHTQKPFTFATDHPLTAQLFSQIWGLKPRTLSKGRAHIQVVKTDDIPMRHIDIVNRRQSFAGPYTPFTFIKQGLRWQYACHCDGSPMLPFHGAIIRYKNRCAAFTGFGEAGKSYLADAVLAHEDQATMIVDDWSLVHAPTAEIHHAGDHFLHVRGSALREKSRQLCEAQTQIVELLAHDPHSRETRYLVRRETLPYFERAGRSKLDTILLIREPWGARFVIRDNRGEVATALKGETGHFWDDSNENLPPGTVGELVEKWRQLLAGVRVLVMDGHRRAPVEEVVEALTNIL